ncbi:Bug family tripartite tricarboxylate transporter substrate binding protein [Azohydromonas lata]|uniref:Tripartite tricarboxylate transporter substrate binding protein n=1 Tax=Azohydromonas lata TaxID=45677 RepID=A0ABU5IPN3_9BURK|nr:tripartite tricarboxylate transporter substrate binding protein [Azohydromonas lata]MDZ5460832.1 tripartite tricarboxylate transporter substrate binding protein [Azohydromonas lata]
MHSFTRSRRRLFGMAAAVLVAAAGGPGAVLAAEPASAHFAGKTVKIVVPNAAGGTSDVLARMIAPKLAEQLGATVVVENKAGATGNLGADFVAKAPADGLTLLLTDIGSLAIAPSVFAQLPFDPVKDFAPVALVAYSPHLLVVSPQLPVKDVRELVSLAKAKPGSVNFAISGTGGANHLAGIEFALRTGLAWSYIPYKGGAQALNDVAAGQADVLFNGMVATLPLVQGGKLKALAVSSAKRFSAAPGVPTVAEAAGLPGFETGSYQGIAAPAGTPPAVVATLHAAVTRILATQEVQARLAKMGAELRPGSPAEFGAFIRSEKDRWARVVKESGAKFD